MPTRLGKIQTLFAAGLLWAGLMFLLARPVARFRSAARPAPPAGDPIHASMTAAPGATVDTADAGAGPPTAPGPPEQRIGIIPGHWQFDTGAVCPDGLQEVDVTLDVAVRTAAILEARGWTVDLLPEHDPNVPQAPILGYRGRAVVSIHADSCDVAGASGFKVARWVHSNTPDEDDLLVGCLKSEYQAVTLLGRHDDSITPDMTGYYALREIGADTPGAIIELGFLKGDRAFLDDHRYEAAMGVANGLRCFLGTAPAAPTTDP